MKRAFSTATLFLGALTLSAVAAAQDGQFDGTAGSNRDRAPTSPEYLPAPDETDLSLPRLTEREVSDAGSEVTLKAVQIETNGIDVSIGPWAPQMDYASSLTVSLNEDEVVGPEWVERLFAYNGMVGEPVSLARIVTMVHAINSRLLAEGFVNSGLLVADQAPLDDTGVLHLRLVLGQISSPSDDLRENIEIAAPERGLSKRFITARLSSLSGKPFNAADFEREFRLLAEDEAVSSVNAKLVPTGRAGFAEMQVKVSPAKRGNLYFTAANSGTPATGAERVAGGFSYRNAITAGDRVSGEMGFTQGVTDARLSYALPFLTPNSTLSVRGGINDASVVDATLAPLDIRTEGYSLGAAATLRLAARPLEPRGDGSFRPAMRVNMRLGADYRRTDTFLLDEPFSFSPGSKNGRAQYGVARIGLDFTLRSVDSALAGGITLSRGLGGTRSDVPGAETPDGNFIGILGQLTYAQLLNQSGLELRGRFAGQYHSSVIYAAERMPVGGYFSVRGYRESLFLADNAAVGSVELAYPLSKRASAQSASIFNGLSVAAFLDAAWFENNVGPDLQRKFVAGSGVSLQWEPTPSFSTRLAYAHAFHDVLVSSEKDLQDESVYFGITVTPLEWF